MNAVLRRLGPMRLAHGLRERRALKSARDVTSRSSVSLQPVYEALERATRGRPSEIEYIAWSAVEKRRAALLACSETVQQLDFGAGSRGDPRTAEEQSAGVIRTMSVSELAAASSDFVWGQFLYYVTRAAIPRAVIELGSCVGISAGYIAAALHLNGKGHLWTLEGSPESARLAGETLHGLDHAQRSTVVVGRFDDTLRRCLKSNGPFDLAFIDGHHDGEATIRYFLDIREHMAHGGLLIFDDIHFSPGMEAAWRTIASHPGVKGNVRIRARGVVAI